MQIPFKNFFRKTFGDKVDPENRYTLYKSTDRKNLLGTVNANLGLSLNESSLYLNRGIAKRGEKVGETQFIIKNEKGDIIPNHPLLALLEKPNKMQTGNQFWKLASIYRDTVGFAIIKKVGNDAVFNENSKISSLELLNPLGVTLVYSDDRKSIKAFGYTDPILGATETIPYEQCIYWYNPNPKKPLEGVSIIESGLRSVLTDQEMAIYQIAVLKNGGMVDSIMSFKNVLSKEQLEKLKEQYKKEYGNSDNAGMPLFLGGDASFQKLALDPQELDFNVSRKLIIDDICVITGVPKNMLGISTGDTYANAETGYRIFLRETAKPIVKDLVNVLDWRLAGDKETIDFIDPTPEDTEMKLKTIKVADETNSVTTNEKREMLGLEPIKGGDELMLPLDRVPQTGDKKGIYVHPLKNKDFRSSYYNMYLKKLNNERSVFKGALRRYFDEQKKRVLSYVSSRKINKKDFSDDIFNERLETTLAFPLLKVLESIAREAGQDTMDLFSQGRKFSLTDNLAMSIEKRFNFFSSKINETTGAELKAQVQEWFAGDEPLAKLVDRVESVYGKIDDYRLATIANTEVASVMQMTKFAGYKQIGLQTKIWVWSEGIKGGVRHNHQDLDGEERNIDVPFSNGMMMPLDQNADAGEVINCECSI